MNDGGSTMLFEASSKEAFGWPDILIWWTSWLRDGIGGGSGGI